jgi:MATE family multidrug resistance protein
MSEWIYWEALALLIGTFGIVPLSVHTIPAQILMITFMGPYSLGIALSIRLGATLPVLVPRAQQTTIDCFVVSVAVFGALSVIMYTQQDWLISLFTTSEAVIHGCHEIWWDVCLYSFVLSVYGIHMGACVGLGMQWTLGTATIISLWMVGLPSTYYLSVLKHGGIRMAWAMIWPPYILLPIVLTIAIMRADWDEIARDIRKREGIEMTDGGRPLFLLSPLKDRNRSISTHTTLQQQPLISSSKNMKSDLEYGSII